MCEIMLTLDNQLPANPAELITDEILEETIFKVLYPKFKIFITAGQHREDALKRMDPDQKNWWWTVKLFKNGELCNLGDLP